MALREIVWDTDRARQKNNPVNCFSSGRPEFMKNVSFFVNVGAFPSNVIVKQCEEVSC